MGEFSITSAAIAAANQSAAAEAADFPDVILVAGLDIAQSGMVNRSDAVAAKTIAETSGSDARAIASAVRASTQPTAQDPAAWLKSSAVEMDKLIATLKAARADTGNPAGRAALPGIEASVKSGLQKMVSDADAMGAVSNPATRSEVYLRQAQALGLMYDQKLGGNTEGLAYVHATRKAFEADPKNPEAVAAYAKSLLGVPDLGMFNRFVNSGMGFTKLNPPTTVAKEMRKVLDGAKTSTNSPMLAVLGQRLADKVGSDGEKAAAQDHVGRMTKADPKGMAAALAELDAIAQAVSEAAAKEKAKQK